MTAIPNLLTDGDVEQISALQLGEAGRLGPHPDTFDWIPGHG